MNKKSNVSTVLDIRDKKKPKALVISPTFFDYYKNIISEFEGFGFQAVWMNTWLYKNPVYKILLRVAPKLVASLSTKKYISNVKGLQLEGVTEILVVKGEGLSVDFIRYLRQAFPFAHLRLYLWDGVENTRSAVQIAPEFDSVSTFDPLDAHFFKWHYRPLFARQVEKIETTSPPSFLYDWVFIGSLHSDRFSVLKRLTHSSRFQKFYVYGYIQGKLILFLRHLINPKFWNHGEIKISTISIPSDQVTSIIQTAKAVVDIEHPKQRGLTMRSIETLLLSRKLVTTNTEIKNCDLFHESRVCVIDRNNPNVPAQFLNIPFLEIPQETKEKYYLRGWLKDIVNS